MTECNQQIKLYDVKIKDKNFYFKNPVKLPKGTELGNNITQKADISATTPEECQGKGVGKGASSIEIKDGKCVFYDDNTNTKNNCGNKCYQLKIKNISDYKKRNGKEIDVGMDDNDGFLIYKQSDYKCNCKNGGYFKNNVCTEYTKTQQQCYNQNRPFVSGTKTTDSKCGEECGSDFYFSSIDNTCTEYTKTQQQCYNQNRPFISGTKTTDSKCGEECGSDFYFSSIDNVCKQNIKPSIQIEQIVYNFDTRIEHEEKKDAVENTYKCDTISDNIYNSKEDAEIACLKNDKCTGIYDISCDSSQFKLCRGNLDSGCADRKVSRYNYSNGNPASCQQIERLCGQSTAQERCPETCKVNKCIGNSLKYDSNGCVYKKTSVELEDCHNSGKILDYTTKKCQQCDLGSFLDKTTNKCVTKGASNKNILKKRITTYKYHIVKRDGITNQKLKQLLLLNGPIHVHLKLDDPVSKKNINANNCPHTIFDISTLGEGQSNHATALVGYGQVNDKNNKKVNYWVIANSWGGEYKKWGNYGFFAVRMTDKLYQSFSQIEYIECKREGSFVNPGLDINDKNLKNATEHNLSLDIINNLNFRDEACSIIDKTTYATGGKENTDMLQKFYSSVIGNKIDDVTFKTIPVRYKHNFSWANPQQNPFRQSFVSTINDQMTCGSCWAFASSYLLQSLISIQYYLEYKKPRNIHLSVRSVIENRYNNSPCVGGDMMEYMSLVNKYGIVPEEECQYPCDYVLHYKLKNNPRLTFSQRIRCSQHNFDRGIGNLVTSFPENFDKVIKIVDELKNKTYTKLKYKQINGNLVIDFDFDDKKCITEHFTEKSKVISCPVDNNNNYIVYLIIGIVVVLFVVLIIFWVRKNKK